MSVKISLRSGQLRVVADADGARRDGVFFVLTSSSRGKEDIVVTLPARDVVSAEVQKPGVTGELVAGGAPEARQP